MLFVFPIRASAGIALIVDAQTQDFLERLSYPIIEAAQLDPNHVKIYIVNDSSINAFVTKGQNIFINTGLIRKFKTPDALIGVIAHEVGHISAGHIPISSSEFKKIQQATILGYILGVAAFAVGSPELGQGILIGSTDIGQKFALKYNRTQEEAADRRALQYLQKIQYPASGLIDLLTFFDMQMRGYKKYINEYTLSHPVSSKRIGYLKNNANFKASNIAINKSFKSQMAMVLAKLEGFLDDPKSVIKKYQGDDSNPARYASAIAYYRDANMKKALQNIDRLISSQKNGYFHELKGQILFESGRAAKSVIEFNKATNLLQPKQSVYSLIYLSQALIDIADRDRDLINFAIEKLQLALSIEANNAHISRLLNIAYGKMGDLFLANYYYANYKYLIGEVNSAYRFAKKAQKILKKSNKVTNSDKIKLEDLIQIIKNDNRWQKKS